MTRRRFSLMRQTWANIVWCHWPVDPEQVAAVLPDGLTPDLFDGHAWVGLIPFSMERLRPPGPFGFITRALRSANFGEVNVRTYVKGPDGKSGVWFCTLDADSAIAVAMANAAFGLPYRVAKTSFRAEGNRRIWTSARRRDGAQAAVTVTVGDEVSRPASPGLETFLFERYSLYALCRGRIIRGELTHRPWLIRPASLDSLVDETVQRAGFHVAGDPHVFVGEPVEVSVFAMTVVDR